jgi:glucoamylase
MQNSVEAVDSLLKVDTGKGVSFYRYNGDVYGFDNSSHPEGKLWVLLTAERGIFELMKGNGARKYLTAIEQFATPTYLLPEQVFEDGMPTESAMPLAWSHASYIILYELLNNPSLLLGTRSLL